MSDDYKQTKLETVGWLIMSGVMLYIMGLMVAYLAVIAVIQKLLHRRGA